jgi:hypothetical protein
MMLLDQFSEITKLVYPLLLNITRIYIDIVHHGLVDDIQLLSHLTHPGLDFWGDDELPHPA